MYILQIIYSAVLNPVYKFTGRISETVRNTMISLSSIGIVSFFIIYFMPVFKDALKWKLTFDTFICSAMLLVIIVFSINGELKPVKWNKLIFYLSFFAGAGVVVISFLHPIGSGYRAWGMLLMFGFPCLYYVWNNRGDYNEFYKRLSAATVIVGIAYYIWCFIMAANGELVVISGRVTANFYDANMYSMIGMIMLSCSTYMLLINRQSKAWFALTALGFGIGINITFLGKSRLSIVIVLGSLLALSIYYLKNRREYISEMKWWKRLLRVEILLISLIVFTIFGKAMIGINTKAIESNTYAQVAPTEVADTYIPAIALDGGPFDRFRVEGHDIDSYTAGRYSIWKGYAQFLNMTGNDFSKADWRALTGKTVKHAHNNFLEIAYRCGIPVACIHILLELVAGIISIIYLFSKKYRDPAYLFVVVFMFTYAIQSMFDIATIPFERPAPFYFYMVMIPIFMYKKESGEEKEAVQEISNVEAECNA